MSIGAVTGVGGSPYDQMGLGAMRGRMGGPPDAEKITDKIMSRFDSDKNGIISGSEAELSEQVLAELDTDGDGGLNSDELQGGIQNRTKALADSLAANGMRPPKGGGPGGMGGMGGMRPPKDGGMGGDAGGLSEMLLDELDSDGDGIADSEEADWSEETLETLDADGDGGLNAEEIQEGIEQRSESMAQDLAANGMAPPEPRGGFTGIGRGAGLRQGRPGFMLRGISAYEEQYGSMSAQSTAMNAMQTLTTMSARI